MEAFRTPVDRKSLDLTVLACVERMREALKFPFYSDVLGCPSFPMKNCDVIVGNDWRFNARAGRSNLSRLRPGFYFYAGMACAIYDACHRVASEPGFRGFDGSADKVRHNAGVESYAKNKLPIKKFRPARQCTSPELLELVEHLARATIYFIAYHEMSHLFLGHLHYKHNPSEPQQLTVGWTQEEIDLSMSNPSSDEKPEDEVPPEIRVLMEFQADTVAVAFLMKHGSIQLGLGSDEEEVTRNLIAGAAIAMALIHEKCGMHMKGYPQVGTRLLSVLNGVILKREILTREELMPKEAISHLLQFLPECTLIGNALKFAPLTENTIRQTYGGDPLKDSIVARFLEWEVPLVVRLLKSEEDSFALELQEIMASLHEFNKKLQPYQAKAAKLIG